MSGFPLECVLCARQCCMYCTLDDVAICPTCVAENQQKEQQMVQEYRCQVQGCETDKKRGYDYCDDHLRPCLKSGCPRSLPLYSVEKVCRAHANGCLRCGTEYGLKVCANMCGVAYCSECFTSRFFRDTFFTSPTRPFCCPYEYSECRKCGLKRFGARACAMEGCQTLICSVCDQIDDACFCEEHRDGCLQCFRLLVRGQPCPVCV